MAKPVPEPRWVTPVFASLILIAMLWLGQDAFRAVFNADDMMNMFVYWSQGPWHLLASLALFFSPSYRPMGGVFYMPLFGLFGLHPLPYHLAAFALMCCNVALVWRVARRLTGSELAAGLTAFLASYQTAMADLYCQTGVIYDILCFLFYFWALDYYLAFRQREELPGRRRLLVLGALYACALNSKEMAVTFPVILLAYEWCFHPPAGWRLSTLARWAAGEARAVWITALMTACYIYGKTHGPDAIANSPSYQGVYTAVQFLEANRAYLAQHFMSRVHFGGAGVVLLWAAMLAIALMMKRGDLRLLWCWALVTPVPVVFVQRAHSCVYIPFAGLAMFAAVVLILAARLAGERLDNVIGRRGLGTAFPVAAALTVALLWAHENAVAKARDLQPYIDADGRPIWSVIEQLNALHPKVKPHARVLFLNNPFPGWEMKFIATLWFHDRTLEVWVERPDNHLAEADWPTCSHIFRFENGRLTESTLLSARAPKRRDESRRGRHECLRHLGVALTP